MRDEPAGTSAVTSEPRLRRGVLGVIPVAGQTFGVMALSAGVGAGVGATFSSAGQATWLAFLLATLAVLCVAAGVAVFARRMATTGSFYSFGSRAFGPLGGWITGWSMVIAYTGGCILSALGSSLALGAFASQVGLPGNSVGLQILFTVVIAGAAAYIAYTDIRLSTRITLALEVVSVLAILVVLFTTLAKRGISDPKQATLTGSDFHGIVFGVVLAFVFLTGFEAAASLGIETRNPYRTIPRTFLTCVVAAGIFFVFASYTTILGFNTGNTNISSSAAPLNDLANMIGLSGFAYIIDLGVAMSFFAAVVAQNNSASRLLFTMSQDGMLPPILGQIHPRTGTPYRGVLLIGALSVVVPVTLIVLTQSASTAFVDAATLDSFGYIGGYLLIVIAAPVYLLRIKQLGIMNVAVAVVGAVALIAVVVTSLYPGPPFPLNLFAYAYFVLVILALIWYAIVKSRSPQVLANIGRSDIEFASEGVVPKDKTQDGASPL